MIDRAILTMPATPFLVDILGHGLVEVTGPYVGNRRTRKLSASMNVPTNEDDDPGEDGGDETECDTCRGQPLLAHICDHESGSDRHD